MGFFVVTRGDVVYVHVEWLRCLGMQAEPVDAGFFACLAQGYLFAQELAGLAVATGLQPAVQFRVVQQDDFFAVGRNDYGAAGQVSLPGGSAVVAAPGKGTWVDSYELDYFSEVTRLGFVAGVVREQGGQQVAVGPGSGAGLHMVFLPARANGANEGCYDSPRARFTKKQWREIKTHG